MRAALQCMCAYMHGYLYMDTLNNVSHLSLVKLSVTAHEKENRLSSILSRFGKPLKTSSTNFDIYKKNPFNTRYMTMNRNREKVSFFVRMRCFYFDSLLN